MNSNNGQSHFRLAIGIWLLLSIGLAVYFFPQSSSSERWVAVRTIGLGLSASLIAVPLGSGIAWACRSRSVVSRILFLATVAMLLVPMFIHVSAWDAAFGKLGWLTSAKGQILVPLVSGWTAATWIHGVAAAPQVALILLIGLQIGGRTLEEQASLDMSRFRVFWHITLRRIAPLIPISIIWIIVSCAREIAVTDLYQVGTLAEQVYLGYSLGLNSIAGNWTPDQLAAVGETSTRLTILMIGWLAATAFMVLFLMTGIAWKGSATEPSRLGKPGQGRTLTALGMLVLLVAIPISNVVVRACFFVRPVDGIPTQGYSLEQLLRSVRRACLDYQDAFMWSLLIAVTSTTLIIFTASVMASVARRSRLYQVMFASLLAVCCAIPGPYIGTTIAAIMSNVESDFLHWLYNYTIAAPVLANFIFCWPIAAVLVWFLFRKVPHDVIESAVLDGAGPVARYFWLGIIGNWLAFVGCWLLTFAVCFGELSASQIVRPAGIDTVPRKMLGDLHAGVNEMTAGITIVTATAIVGLTLLGWWFLRLNKGMIDRK